MNNDLNSINDMCYVVFMANPINSDKKDEMNAKSFLKALLMIVSIGLLVGVVAMMYGLSQLFSG